jgi:pimeloyl-ACP methyl ester carboxylesterase
MATQFIHVQNGRLAYDRSGSGPLVIEIPSMGDLRAEYRFLTPGLAAAGYQVVSMDLRGHGESSTEWNNYSVKEIGQDILALVDALDAGPAILIGDSVAAGAAVWAAVEAPERIKAMVLLGPAVRGEVSGLFRMVLGVLFARPWGPSAWNAFFKTLFPTRKPADFAAYSAALKKNLSELGRLEALRKMIFASKEASAERVQHVRVPALVLMGTRDPDFKDPAAEAAWLAAGLKADFEMIEGAGHYPHVDSPEVVGPRIIEFLQTLESGDQHVENNEAKSRAG